MFATCFMTTATINFVEQVPKQVPKQECKNIPKQVPKQECRNVPRQECRNVPKQVPKQECRNVPRQVMPIKFFEKHTINDKN